MAEPILPSSSPSVPLMLIHPPNKLFVSCTLKTSKELNISNIQLANIIYITLLDTEVSIVDSNFRKVTGFEAASFSRNMTVLEI